MKTVISQIKKKLKILFFSEQSLALPLACGLALGIASAADAQVLRYQFDTESSTQPNSGSSSQAVETESGGGVPADLTTADGTGVSGQSGDLAVNFFTGLDWESSGRSAVGADISELDGLSSFTISGWAKNGESDSEGRGRIFRAFDDNDGIDLRFATSGAGDRLELDVNGAGEVDSLSDEDQFSGFLTSNWTFFAATYDATDGSVNFYSGGKTGPLINTSATFGTNPGNVGTINLSFFISNVEAGGSSSPFLAWMDDFRFYGSTTDSSGALSGSELTSVRNSAVSEP